MRETKIILISQGNPLAPDSFKILDEFFKDGWKYRANITQRSSSHNCTMYASVAVVIERKIT